VCNEEVEPKSRDRDHTVAVKTNSLGNTADEVSAELNGSNGLPSLKLVR